MKPLEFMRLFPEFAEPSWSRWRRVLERLTPDVREFYAICGRGSGKSRIVALLACAFASREYDRAPGEAIYIGCFGPDRRQAKLVYEYVLGLLRSRRELAALIEHQTKERIQLRGDVVIEVLTADRRSPRGRSYGLVILEEASMFSVDETAADPDKAIYEAVMPALGRIEGSLLAVIGTPYRRAGLLYEAFRDGDDEDRIVVSGDTLTFNPSFSRRVIDRAFQRDPISAASEYGRDGEIHFRSDLSALLAEDAIRAVVPEGVVEIPPDLKHQRKVHAHFDASTGSGSDAAALGIAFAPVKGGVAELACVRQWKPPFSPSSVIQEAAKLATSYGVREVGIDRFAPGLIQELFREHGITANVAELDTSATFTELLALVNSRRVRLLDHPALLAEVRRLERRPGSGGRDRVGHPPNAHDDVAAAGAGALIQASKAPADNRLTWGEPGRFIGIGTAARRVQPSSHNPRVAQDLVDYVEGSRERHERLQERVRRDARRDFDRLFRHR